MRFAPLSVGVALGRADEAGPATCEAAPAAMETDPDMRLDEIPFDPKRMTRGGFKPILDTGQ